jgi:hypothetical protein
MSGQVVRVGKASLAFGLLWAELPSGDSIRADIKKLARDHEAQIYVQLPTVGKFVQVGFLPESAEMGRGTSKIGSLPAAALLAHLYLEPEHIENAMFGFELPNNQCALIGFRNGKPEITFDRVVKREKIQSVVAEFVSFMDGNAATVTFFGDSTLFEGRNTVDFPFDWFQTAALKKSKLVNQLRMKRVKFPAALSVAVVLILLASFGGFKYYEQYQAELQKKEKLKKIDPNIAYEQSVTPVLAAAGYPVFSVAAQSIKAIEHLPLSHRGWKLEKISCTPGSCTLNWNNNEGGTYQSFADSPLPGIASLKTAYKEGLTSMETMFAYPLNTESSGVNKLVLPKQDEFVLKFGSKAQQLKEMGISILLTKASVIGLPQGRAGQPEITESMLKDPIKEGGWSLTTDWLFHSMLQELPENMTISNLDVAVSGETLSMTASGKYYVKN